MEKRPERRSRVAVTRLTEKEFHELLEASAKLDMSFSDLLRTAALLLARSEYKN